jgi:polysaccharide biosynthesis/export protein
VRQTTSNRPLHSLVLGLERPRAALSGLNSLIEAAIVEGDVDLGAYSTSIDGLRPIFRFAFLALLTVSLCACAKRGGTIPYAPPNFGPPDKASASDVAYDLELGPLDLLKVTVFRVPELTGEYQVDARGVLEMPLVGPLNVRQFTPSSLAKELERLYGQRLLNNPEIIVRVMKSDNNSVTVEGGVNLPGIYPIPGRTTLVGAVAMARGVAAQDANPRRVAIFRKIDGKTVAAAFDLVSIRRGEMADPDIYPGDTVVVDSSTVRPIYRDLISTLPIIALFQYL